MSSTVSPKGQEFLAFFQELFAGDPRMTACVGADEKDIEALLAYADQPLPALYLDYLRLMGTNDGPLRLALDAECSAKSVAAYLERCGNDWKDYQPTNSFRISTNGSTFARALLYRDDAPEPCVIINNNERILETVAETFESYLFRHAWQRRLFTGHNNPSVPELHIRGTNINTLDDVKHTAKERGFSLTWFSDRWSACGEKGSIRFITLFSAHDVHIYFADEDRHRAADECAAFRSILGSSYSPL
ncbi:hypothetical protein KBD61_03745 [Patescibacteria group bacterium]|nr:hypothetical protein [Patescibacteria group bacterium]MBP9710110.1 hypothetical protein [Patescibacteria group bacterium]